MEMEDPCTFLWTNTEIIKWIAELQNLITRGKHYSTTIQPPVTPRE